MSDDLKKRVLHLELDAAAKRVFWSGLVVVFCTGLGVSSFMSGGTVPAVVFMVLAGLNVITLPRNWKEMKRLKGELNELQ